MARVDFDPGGMEPRAFYRLITASVVPRPIAWVSSRSPEGADNLAPHSFFTVSCVDPPVMQFTSVGRKDSQRNIEATGEFVINLSPRPLLAEVNATATDFPPEVSEFEAVGLRTEPSATVAPWRVADSPIAFECSYLESRSYGDSTVIFGRVLHAAVAEEVLGEGGLPEPERLQPLARLGTVEWSALGEVLRIRRIPYREWPGHFASDRPDRARHDETSKETRR